jgi:hypothetical protein
VAVWLLFACLRRARRCGCVQKAYVGNTGREREMILKGGYETVGL